MKGHRSAPTAVLSASPTPLENPGQSPWPAPLLHPTLKSVAKPSNLYLRHIFHIYTSPCIPLPQASMVPLLASLTGLLAPISLSHLLGFLNHVYCSFMRIHSEQAAISARNPSGILHFGFLTFQPRFLLSPTPTPHSNLISYCTHTYFTFQLPGLLAIPRIPCIFLVALSAGSPLYLIHLCPLQSY